MLRVKPDRAYRTRGRRILELRGKLTSFEGEFNMKTLNRLFCGMLLTAVGALANDHLVQIRDEARNLEREFRAMHAAAKAKNFQATDLQEKVTATGTQVARLKSLSEEFEASNPKASSVPEWKQTKDLITLLEIFHGQKSQAVAGRDKGLIKAHADGLARRAMMLHTAADKALKSMGS
jgi:hypothetical protein